MTWPAPRARISFSIQETLSTFLSALASLEAKRLKRVFAAFLGELPVTETRAASLSAPPNVLLVLPAAWNAAPWKHRFGNPRAIDKHRSGTTKTLPGLSAASHHAASPAAYTSPCSMDEVPQTDHGSFLLNHLYPTSSWHHPASGQFFFDYQRHIAYSGELVASRLPTSRMKKVWSACLVLAPLPFSLCGRAAAVEEDGLLEVEGTGRPVLGVMLHPGSPFQWPFFILFLHLPGSASPP